MPFTELLEVSGQEEAPGGRLGHDAHLARDRVVEALMERCVQVVHALHQGHGKIVELPAGRGEGDTRTPALEQFDPELLLQRAHLLRGG